jgi:hypothetical protein
LKKKRRKALKLRILGKCLVCGKLFVFEDYEISTRRHYYCGPTCKNHAKRKARTKDDEVRQKEAKPKVVAVGFYVAKGASLNAYTLEDDPWKSGRLPESVTGNALWRAE